ncbi:MAG: glycosyltransferase family 4 protein [Oligosphaeraceae bacterium]|nr:glycosyltransferase family 4 protein [Oligosphaeraceae bacterium]
MSSKLSICHVITRMIIGGAQENTLYTIQGHLEKGHEVTLITGKSEGPEGSLLQKKHPESMRLIEVPELIRAINPLKDYQAYRKLLSIFRQERFDVVHTHASKAGILGRFAAHKAKVPFIVHTVHGQAFHPYQSAWKNRLYIALERMAAKRCHKIFAVAQAMIDQCVKAKVAPKRKYMVVYSGMDLQAFMNAKPEAELRRKLGLPKDAPVIGTVARIFELKGYETLVEAAPALVAKVPNLRFLLVGDGILREKIEQRIAELELQEHFVFAGLVPPEEVCRYTALMDVLLHLSLREGLPRSAVQALASAVPVVAYPLDGTPEVVLPDMTGFLCEVENVEQIVQKTLLLLENPELRHKLGENGQRLVRQLFDWRLMADILEKEYYKGLEPVGEKPLIYPVGE